MQQLFALGHCQACRSKGRDPSGFRDLQKLLRDGDPRSIIANIAQGTLHVTFLEVPSLSHSKHIIFTGRLIC